jgi:hypothetical protein
MVRRFVEIGKPKVRRERNGAESGKLARLKFPIETCSPGTTQFHRSSPSAY